MIKEGFHNSYVSRVITNLGKHLRWPKHGVQRKGLHVNTSNLLKEAQQIITR